MFESFGIKDQDMYEFLKSFEGHVKSEVKYEASTSMKSSASYIFEILIFCPLFVGRVLAPRIIGVA